MKTDFDPAAGQAPLPATPPPGLPVAAPGSAWQQLAQARTVHALCQAWLAVLCGELTQAQAGVVLLADADGAFAPAGTWPPGRALNALSDVARQAMTSRTVAVQRSEAGALRCAYPLLAGDGALVGAVVVDLGSSADGAALAACRQWLHWGAAWLLDLANQQGLQAQARRLAHTGFVLDLVLGTLGAPGFRESTLALVNRMAERLGCHQVLLALDVGQRLRIQAVSHAATFDERSSRFHLAVEAMSEAADQRQRTAHPAAEAEGPAAGVADLALRRYAEAAGAAAVLAQPLEQPGRVVGVLLLERDRPFQPDELQLLEAMGLALATTLAQRRQADEGLAIHARRSLRTQARRLVDSSHPGLKLAAAAGAALLLVLALVPAPFRVSAPATVEGTVQRAAVAPFDGFVREAPGRAGDSVKVGQVLAVLEDQELRLERVRYEAELELAQRKESEAMSAGKRVEQRLAAAQANQARAQLGLVMEKLARVAITAPVDGVVVKGDLSQQLGSPVQQGQVLFEVAAAGGWRVVLKVDERDIAQVQPGQPGELVLASLPDRAWPFTVQRVTPVSVAEEGRNTFRVEAALGRDAPVLSPNMQGVGKVTVGRAGLLWVWTRPLLDWLRLAWWKLVP